MIYSENLIEKLRERLQQPLPGLDAQMEMAPPIRGRDIEIPDNARKSAVLFPLYPHKDRLHLAFMRRAEDGRVHGGQVSLPGGKHEPEDPDFTFTALRETEEEIGISPTDINVLGALSPIYIPPSNFLVYPTVGFMPQRPIFNLNPTEVAGIIEVEVGQLLQEHIIDRHKVDVFGGMMIEAPGYTVNENALIWGGTAMMIAELVAIIREINMHSPQI